jgi:hypothetical protein
MKCPDCGAVWYEDPPSLVFKCPLCGYPYQHDCCGREEKDRAKELLKLMKELKEGK